MSFQIQPLETVLAIAATGIAIRKAGGDPIVPANIQTAANTALEVASVFSAFGQSGDLSAALQQIAQLAQNPNLDPTVALVLQNLFGIAEGFAQLPSTISKLLLIGATAQAIANNIASGISQAANAYLQKYPVTPPAASQSATVNTPATPPPAR